MRQDVVLNLYFVLLATLVLLLAPSYLLAVIKLVQLILESTNNEKMPQKLDNSPLVWDKKPKNECKHVPLSCPWIITSKVETLTVIITCLKWTFKYDFWIRVHPEGNSEVSKQIDLDDHHNLPKSYSDALNLYEASPGPHLNSFQLEILEELIEHLDLKCE